MERIEGSIRDLIKIFQAEISQHKLDVVRDYLKVNELGLAFETLIEYIIESEVFVNDDAYFKLEECGNRLWSSAYDRLGHRNIADAGREDSRS